MGKDKFNSNSLKQFINMDGLNGTELIERKRLSSKISISDNEEKTVVSLISNSALDEDGDCIIPSGVDLKRFQLNPVVLWSHNYSEMPVGKVVAISVTDDGIVAKIKLADTEKANDVWSLIKGNFLSANSIGFIAKEVFYKGTEEFKSYIKENKIKVSNACERIISKFELLENSFCAIGCNPEALNMAISEKSINLSNKTIKELDLPNIIIKEVIEVKEDKPNDTANNTPSITSTETITSTESIKEIIKEVIDEKMVEMAKIEEVKEEKKEESPKIERYIKVIRNGGVDLNKLIELKKLSKIGKII